MFESRLFFVDKLIDMGAQIILCDPHRATVIGLGRKNNLRGITMSSPDITCRTSIVNCSSKCRWKKYHSKY
jgi:UDP-N-acetylglucosamine 1-carboxyvinyltransferase